MKTNSEREKSQLSRILEKHTEVIKELDKLRSDYNLMEAKVNWFYNFHIINYHKSYFLGPFMWNCQSFSQVYKNKSFIWNESFAFLKNMTLRSRVSELERLRTLDQEDFKQQLDGKSEKIQSLNESLDNLEKEYESLLGIKIGLDIEISAYRKMLEGEEER